MKTEREMAGIKYTTKDIYDQDFKITMRGYSKEEVDEFLDEIMKDYDTYEAKIKNLKEEISRLKSQGAVASTTSTASASGQTSVPSSSSERGELRPGSATNFDILKRINRLEKEVFGKQISDN